MHFYAFPVSVSRKSCSKSWFIWLWMIQKVLLIGNLHIPQYCTILSTRSALHLFWEFRKQKMIKKNYLQG